MNTITLPAGWTTRHFSERDGGRFTIGIYNSETACVGTYRFAGFTVEHQHRWQTVGHTFATEAEAAAHIIERAAA